MNVFEDAGYFCVDNLPAEMIRSLAELFLHEGSKVERAAVVCDLRGGEYFDALAERDRRARARPGVPLRVLFLEADEQTLIDRYKETRRRHPLAPQGNVADGIRRRAALLAPVRSAPTSCIDTTGLERRRAAAQGRRRAARVAATAAAGGHLHSFGHKHGPPRDADLAFDVRFLPNPHYEAELRAADRASTRASSTTSAATAAWRSSTTRAAAAAGLPAAAVRGRGQGAPRRRDRLHRRPPPLRGDRRAPRRRASATRRTTSSRFSTATSTGCRSAERPVPPPGRVRPASSRTREKGPTHVRTRRDQRLRPHRPQRVPRRPGAERRHRDRRRQRPHRLGDARAPAQVRLDPRAVPGHGRGRRTAR